MKFYTITDKYVNFLRGYDNKVSENKKRRPYVGVVLTIGDIKYLAPLSSPKPNHDKFTSKNPTIHKLFGEGNPPEKLGVVHINNMIPVISSEITMVDFSIQQPDYKAVLEKQYRFLKSTQDTLMKKAHTLHDAIVNKKEPIYSKFSGICCDFIILEANYKSFT